MMAILWDWLHHKLTRPWAAFVYVRDLVYRVHCEDDAGTVPSSTRWLATGLYGLLGLVVSGTVAYPFVCLWRGTVPDSTVIVALVGAITALGGIQWGTNRNRT